MQLMWQCLPDDRRHNWMIIVELSSRTEISSSVAFCFLAGHTSFWEFWPPRVKYLLKRNFNLSLKFVVEACENDLSSAFGNAALSLKENSVGGERSLLQVCQPDVHTPPGVSAHLHLRKRVCVCVCAMSCHRVISSHHSLFSAPPRSVVPTGVFWRGECVRVIHDKPSASLTHIYTTLTALTPNPLGGSACVLPLCTVWKNSSWNGND